MRFARSGSSSSSWLAASNASVTVGSSDQFRRESFATQLDRFHARESKQSDNVGQGKTVIAVAVLRPPLSAYSRFGVVHTPPGTPARTKRARPEDKSKCGAFAAPFAPRSNGVRITEAAFFRALAAKLPKRTSAQRECVLGVRHSLARGP